MLHRTPRMPPSSPNQPRLCAPASSLATPGTAFSIGRRARQKVGRALCWIASGLACSIAVGCSQPHLAPRAAVSAYASALRRGEPQVAYGWLSAEARAQLTEAAFVDLYNAHRESFVELARRLSTPSGPAELTAWVRLPGGAGLELVFEDGQWRVLAKSLELYRQDTPMEALRTFLRAYDRQRYDVLLNLAPEASRAETTPQELQEAWEGDEQPTLQRIVIGLRAGLQTAQVEVVGRRATVRYGADSVVELVREGGDWKIEDF